jgi:hypothetical protein
MERSFVAASIGLRAEKGNFNFAKPSITKTNASPRFAIDSRSSRLPFWMRAARRTGRCLPGGLELQRRPC